MNRHREKAARDKPRREVWDRCFLPQKEPTLLTPRCHTVSLQDGETVRFYGSSHSVLVLCHGGLRTAIQHILDQVLKEENFSLIRREERERSIPCPACCLRARSPGSRQVTRPSQEDDRVESES